MRTMRFLSLLYDIVFILGAVVYLPFHFARRKITPEALRQKCTLYPESIRQNALRLKRTIWIQVVSVGEVTLIQSLVEYLERQLGYDVAISVTTLTGHKVAARLYPEHLVIYFPFDVSVFIRRVIRLVKPAMFISIETEMWPNLYLQLKKHAVRIVILNGRISEKAFSRYRRVYGGVKKILNLADCIGVQNEFYRDRFLALGASSRKIVITGNLKFSNYHIKRDRIAAFKEKYYSRLKPQGTMLLVAASTHNPEEKIILDCFRSLHGAYPSLRLMVVPRHIERAGQIKQQYIQEGFGVTLLSEGFSRASSGDDVFLVDTVGDLLSCYAVADICFVGGSLADTGGHNILEPLYFSKPTLFGPHMDNFREIENVVLKHQAGIPVKNEKELTVKIEELITDSDLRQELVQNSHQIFEEGHKTLENSVACIRRLLD